MERNMNVLAGEYEGDSVSICLGLDEPHDCGDARRSRVEIVRAEPWEHR